MTTVQEKHDNRYAEEEIIQDDSFSYDGYQVVRGELFCSHL